MRSQVFSSTLRFSSSLPQFFQASTPVKVCIRALGQYDPNPNHSYVQRRFYQKNHEKQTSKKVSVWGLGGTLCGISIVGYVIWRKPRHVLLESQSCPSNSLHEQALKHLPNYSRNEVGEHYDESRRIWVSFRRGVYDVTDFVAVHPGGSRILMAAGGSLEPFWELYPVHQKSDVFNILEKYRIGNLCEEDVLQASEAVDHFQGEPSRHPALLRRSDKPFNGETPPVLLQEKFYTPNDIFYVRNHLPVPHVDAKTYRLEIEGIDLQDKTFSLKQLQQFPKACISATIQCGGNRRTEMGKDKAVAGLAWTGGAIGNAKWTGVKLLDVLKAAGFNPEKYKNRPELHIKFDGLDMDHSGECYGASIPLSYLLDANFEAILAFEMNDKPLPIDHGFPVRVILPGIVGARSVKWLGKITISDEESQSPWQQRDYKVFSPSVTLETVDFASAPAITDTPVTSYICSHISGEKVPKGSNKLQGYAFSGGGKHIIRVEISLDEGKTWTVARISNNNPKMKAGTKNWSWVLWETTVDIQRSSEVWVKAVDSGYNQQPENYNHIWNYRGLLSTAYHKIKLVV